MAKLLLMDNTITVLEKMASGNPGAINAIMNIMKCHVLIDPDSALGSMGVFFKLDDMEIYGSDLYVFYSDVCDSDVRKVIVLIRSCQLGNLSTGVLKTIAAGVCHLTAEDWIGHDEFVCSKLQNFNKAD